MHPFWSSSLLVSCLPPSPSLCRSLTLSPVTLWEQPSVSFLFLSLCLAPYFSALHFTFLFTLALIVSHTKATKLFNSNGILPRRKRKLNTMFLMVENQMQYAPCGIRWHCVVRCKLCKRHKKVKHQHELLWFETLFREFGNEKIPICYSANHSFTRFLRFNEITFTQTAFAWGVYGNCCMHGRHESHIKLIWTP